MIMIKAFASRGAKEATHFISNKYIRPHKAISDRVLYYLKNTKDDGNKQYVPDKKVDDKIHEIGSKVNNNGEIQERISQQISQLEDRNQKYKIVSRNYNETKVPGLESRKYSSLNELQQEIVKNNKFDLMNPEIIPKSGATNSYVGITEQLTEISLGHVKIKGQHEVFLSEVDPQNIPADLDIRFDSKKELKVVGKQTKQDKSKAGEEAKTGEGEVKLEIQPETIEQKTISEHMEKEFGMGVKSYKYSNIKNWRRWDIFLSLLFFAFLIPIQDTFRELNQLYNSTKAIEEERMKQITQLKKRSYQRVLLENKDFNVRLSQ